MAVSYLAEVYRERAEACFTLAKTANDASSRSAFEKLGREMIEAAEAVEPTTPKVCPFSRSRRQESDRVEHSVPARLEAISNELVGDEARQQIW
jgi:hypothetical protein